MTDPFRTTRWSLVLAAARRDTVADDALSELCQAYWRPIHAYIRRHGHAPGEAADLTQAFFLYLLEHRGFERADPTRGRFRAYLITAARNFLSNARDHAMTLRGGARTPHQSMDATDAERYLALNASDLESSPEAVFERQWALRLTERALDRLKRDYVEREQEPLFEQLCPLLTSEAPHQNRSSGTDMGNDAFRTALSRARRRFGEALRAEIRETVSNPEEVEDELRHLLRVLTA